MMEIEVVYARPQQQLVRRLTVADGCTVGEALECSGLLATFGGALPEGLQAGVFGQLKRLDEFLLPGDRVEIYRPLRADPKQARRERLRR